MRSKTFSLKPKSRLGKALDIRQTTIAIMFDPHIWKKLRRGPQVILLKDAAMISALTGLQSGDRVIDCGAGSGFLSCYLGSIVAPAGKVYAYEKREEFQQLSAKNVEKARLSDVVDVKLKDNVLESGFEEKDVDLVTLDMGDSHLALPHAFAALKGGGFCVGYLPHAEQVQTFVKAALVAGFEQGETIEVIVRPMLVRERGFRPENSGLLHTAYLTFLRKPRSGPHTPKQPHVQDATKTT
ncbi:tRNA methyltransferase [Candidatus Micrarchaeota archaeon]|nr:tRNA methyltransferase [Candidatus Micrarchaeota archaeon]